MAWESGNYPTASGVYQRIVDQLQNVDFMGSGNQWQLIYNYNDNGTTLPGAWGLMNGLKVPGHTRTGDYVVGLGFGDNSGYMETNTAIINFLIRNDIPPSGYRNNGSGSFIGVFASGILYNIGDYVLDRGVNSAGFADRLYQCKIQHTGLLTIEPSDAAGAPYWELTEENAFTFRKNFYQDNNGVGNNGFTKCKKEDLVNGITYWLVANEKRAVIVLKSETRWFFSYVGGYDTFLPLNINKFPCLTTVCSINFAQSFLNSNNFNWPISMINISASNRYRSVIFRSLSTAYTNYSLENGNASPFDTFPHEGLYYSEDGYGNKILTPVYIKFPNYNTHLEQGLYGVADGIFLVDPTSLVSGDIIVYNSIDYLVVENVYRGSSQAMIALRLQ
jgi:hypothetical protein